MITFWNDHLVSPVFCKLIYDSIPEAIHVPVIFVPHTDEYRTLGYATQNGVCILLQSIFYFHYPGEFELWKTLLFTTYHEFGHHATYPIWRHFNCEGEFGGNVDDYIEELADDWANQTLLRVAGYEKRLCQPERLGPYFDGRILKIKMRIRNWEQKHGRINSPIRWMLKDYRRFKSGGQLSSGDVARESGAYKYPKRLTFKNDFVRFPKVDTHLINRLAADLGFAHIDSAGRRHLYFAWGDLPEISRRVAIYKAIHSPSLAELEYLEDEKLREARLLEKPLSGNNVRKEIKSTDGFETSDSEPDWFMDLPTILYNENEEEQQKKQGHSRLLQSGKAHERHKVFPNQE